MHTRRRLRLRAHDEILIQRLRQKWHDRRKQARQRGQYSVKRLIGGLLVLTDISLPDTPTVAADVPVAQLVVDELLRFETELADVVILQRRAGRLDGFAQV